MTETTAQDPAAAAVRLDVREHVAWITINRPPLNVLDVATNRALSTTVRSLSKRSDVRVVALTGAGIRAFSSGVDIADHTRDRVGPMLDAFHGAHNAAHLILTGETIDARRAHAIGLVNEVAPDAGFDAAAEAFVAKFARHSGAALKLATEAHATAMRGGRKPDEFLRELSRIETLYTKKLMATHDATEGIAAWQEKRPPTWRDS